MHGTRDADGHSAFERVTLRKLQHKIDAKKYPCGKVFYNQVLATYRSATSEHTVLTNHQITEQVAPELFKHMLAYKNGHSRDGVFQWLDTATTINGSELAGLLAFFSEINAPSSLNKTR